MFHEIQWKTIVKFLSKEPISAEENVLAIANALPDPGFRMGVFVIKLGMGDGPYLSADHLYSALIREVPAGAMNRP